MGVPKDKDAKRFYQAAKQRLEDAEFLLEAARTLAAVYLSGYCVECMWKALIITQAGKDKKGEVLDLFAGSKAHDFRWLRSLYETHGGPPPSKKDKGLARAFETVGSWSTHLRYALLQCPKTTRTSSSLPSDSSTRGPTRGCEMGVTIRGPGDPVVDAIAGAIRKYTDAHPGAKADVHRYGNGIVQAWVVDPDFCGKSHSERRRIFWPLLDALDDEISAELTTFLLLTPEEKDEYAGHTDFENPTTFDEDYAAVQATRRGKSVSP